LYSQLLAIWTPDVKANQMSDLLAGIAPVRSMVKAGSGVADLILLPLEQYRKDGKIVKGVRRGASSFATNTLSEFATIGAQLATGTQVILEKAERALGGRQAEDSQLPDMMESINITEYEASLAGKRSRYADQPADLPRGISAAYTSLTSNLTSAAQTILAVPMEVIEETGNQQVSLLLSDRRLSNLTEFPQSATRAVIRAVPIAVLQTMIGVTDASRKTLFGVKNQLDPRNQGDKESKYKRR
jgi:autophagy-related protein 2